MSVRYRTDDAGASRLWEIEALSRLQQIAGRCARAGSDFEGCLEAILDAGIYVTAADRGTLQLLDPWSECLVIRAQRGFQQPFLDYHSYIHKRSETTCGAAFAAAQRVIVPDVANSELFAGKPARALLLEANVRAVQSTPLTTHSGRVVGVLSTHFTHPSQLGERELSFMNVLARRAADYVEGKQLRARFRR